MPIWKKKEPTPLTGPAAEIQAAASLMKATWRALERAESHLRKLVDQSLSGRHITTTGAAQVLRGAADMINEASVKLHDAARRLEPPSSSIRVTRKTPKV